MDCKEGIYLEDIYYLAKTGNKKELDRIFHQKEYYCKDHFVIYMDYLIKKSEMTRTEIINRAGLSPGYMYKVLNGEKATVERDYLIAFCIAMQSDLIETQMILNLAGFPELDINDKRSAIIMSAITCHENIRTLNDMLGNMNEPFLRTEPKLPRAEFIPVRYTNCGNLRLNYKGKM